MPAPKKRMSGLSHVRPSKEQTLFGEQLNPEELVSQTHKTLHDTDRFRTKYIELNSIVDNTTNRFKVSDTSFLEASIAKLGQLQPLVVIQKQNEHGMHFEIKAGSRRFKALTNLRLRAVSEGNTEDEERFSYAFCIVLPDGASQEEIDAVITETNTTARNISIAEIFMNFDLVFDLDEDGNYKYLPKNKNKYNSASSLLKSMGYTFSPSSIKQYLSIYTAHNQDIRKEFENGLLTKKRALAISRMAPLVQDDIMGRFNDLDDEQIDAIIAKQNKEKKKLTKDKPIRGSETLNIISRARKQMTAIIDARSISFSDELQKNQVQDALDELKADIAAIEQELHLLS